jgi:putative oxidoreductase
VKSGENMTTSPAFERIGSVAARAALAAIFLISGFGKLAAPAAAGAAIASKGLPEPALLAALAGLTEFGGGLLLLAGYRARAAALGLALFLVTATILFHNPVGLTGAEAHLQQIQLLKNVAIFGGLLAVATRGAGAASLDALGATREGASHLPVLRERDARS